RVTSVPPMATDPASSSANPEIASSSVLFPAPFGPMIATISPACTVTSTPSQGTTAPKRTRAPRTASAISASTGCLRKLERLNDRRLYGTGMPLESGEHPCDAVRAVRHDGDDRGAGAGEYPILNRRRRAEHLAEVHDDECSDQCPDRRPDPTDRRETEDGQRQH